jgi:PIN domain nuclease of toxin-antitoxin system
MNLLLDTQLLLWSASAPGKVPKKLRALLNDENNTPLFSAASLWEISIKNSLGRKDFQVNTALLKRGLVDNGWEELAITSSHALATEHLPPLHKDPFDRMLLAQAEVEGFMLYTTDKLLAKYPGPVKLV